MRVDKYLTIKHTFIDSSGRHVDCRSALVNNWILNTLAFAAATHHIGTRSHRILFIIFTWWATTMTKRAKSTSACRTEVAKKKSGDKSRHSSYICQSQWLISWRYDLVWWCFVPFSALFASSYEYFGVLRFILNLLLHSYLPKERVLPFSPDLTFLVPNHLWPVNSLVSIVFNTTHLAKYPIGNVIIAPIKMPSIIITKATSVPSPTSCTTNKLPFASTAVASIAGKRTTRQQTPPRSWSSLPRTQIIADE